MTIRKNNVKNFKSLYEVSLQPGKVNVLIGAHGSGKSTILVVIEILSNAMKNIVNNSVLQRKGIFLGASTQYESKFKTIKREELTVDLGIQWEDGSEYDYFVQLNTPTDDKTWKHRFESLNQYGNLLWEEVIDLPSS